MALAPEWQDVIKKGGISFLRSHPYGEIGLLLIMTSSSTASGPPRPRPSGSARKQSLRWEGQRTRRGNALRWPLYLERKGNPIYFARLTRIVSGGLHNTVQTAPASINDNQKSEQHN